MIGNLYPTYTWWVEFNLFTWLKTKASIILNFFFFFCHLKKHCSHSGDLYIIYLIVSFTTLLRHILLEVFHWFCGLVSSTQLSVSWGQHHSASNYSMLISLFCYWSRVFFPGSANLYVIYMHSFMLFCLYWSYNTLLITSG